MKRNAFAVLQLLIFVFYILYYRHGKKTFDQQNASISTMSSSGRVNITDTGGSHMTNGQDKDELKNIPLNDPGRSSCDCLLNENCFNNKSNGFLEYNQEDSNMCLFRLAETQRNVVITLVGDSRMRSLFPVIQDLLGIKDSKMLQYHQYSGTFTGKCERKYYSTSNELKKSNFKVQFFWRPVLDEELFSLIDDITSACKGNPPADKPYVQCPTYLFTDLHFHVLVSCNVSKQERFPWFKSHISQYLQHLNNLSQAGVNVVYKRTDSYLDFFQGIGSDTRYEIVSKWMGTVQRNIGIYPNLKFWSSSEVFVAQKRKECSELPVKYQTPSNAMARRLCGDGIHYGRDLMRKEIQIMMNYICNSVLHKQEPVYCS